MCILSVVNTGDENLNKQFLLILQTLGSSVHSDGWGFVSTKSGKSVKSELPAQWTSNYGNILRKLDIGTSPVLGHIRKASSNVPVCFENAHPFVKNGITFMHNGTLSPQDDKKFVTTYEAEVEETNWQKATVKVKKKLNYSDSLIFFEHFMKILETNSGMTILDAVAEAMKDFTGKFAFLIHDARKKSAPVSYVFRGSTADLHFRTLYIGKSPIGYVINTNSDFLLRSIVMLNNLRELQGLPTIGFSDEVDLEKDTAYILKPLDLEKIGEVHENEAPKTYSYTTHYAGGAGNFQSGGNSTTTKTGKVASDIVAILKFMDEYSISPDDFQLMIFSLYSCSVVEMDEKIIRHFVKKIMPYFASKVKTSLRKKIKQANGGLNQIPYAQISLELPSLEFPWMLSDVPTKNKLAEILAKLGR